jgi:radical SAM superfamily enzyme YgiQ (UPF0313 family)
MRITLIHPPDGMLPTVPYASMPCLTSCLAEHGHEVSVRDVNLELFDTLLQRDKLEGWYDDVEARTAELTAIPELSKDDSRELWRLQRLLAIPREIFAEIEDSLAVMRDLDRFLQPDVFNRAFDVVRSCQRLAFAMNPASFTEPHRGAADVLKDSPGPLADPPIDAMGPIADSILAGDPELVGVTFPYDSSIFYGLKLMRLLKQRKPDLPIIVGGAGIDSFAYQVSKDPAYFEVFDYAMVGEGELAFPKLADLLEAGEEVRGGPVDNLRWLQPDGTLGATEMVMITDLNAIPSPDFTSMDIDGYLLPDPVGVFQTSRGCYYGKCTFCSEIFRKGFRMRRPDLVVEDMVKIYESTGIRHFQLWDSLAPPKTLKKVAQQIKARGLPFEWMAETKFEKPYLKEDMIRTLAEGGCTFLLFGFESASSKVLDLIDKGNDLVDVDTILAHMKKHGIRAGMSWFIGFPGETEREADTTFDFIGLRRDRIQFSNYTRTYDIGTDTIVYENQDRFDLEVFETPEGSLDYKYKDGSGHWDRDERDQAFHVRGDFHQVKNHVELHYAKVDVPTALRITGQERMGPLIRHVDPDHLSEARFQVTAECSVREFQRHPFDPSMPLFAVAYHMITGHVFDLDPDALGLVGLLGAPRTIAEIMADSGRTEERVLELLELAVNRGLVRVVCDEAHVRWVPEAELATAEVA